jgi:AAA15 family ATPase/GTPase
MILEFSVKNFRSIKDLQTISFVATGLKSKDEELDKNNIVEIDGYRILKTIGIYGANASGKSNVLKALEDFSRIISDSKFLMFSIASQSSFYYYEKKEIIFQVIILIEGKKYRYGYIINDKKITDEWLYGPANENQTWYFIRESPTNIKVNDEYFPSTKYADVFSSDTVLFLSYVARLENNIAKKICDFFSRVDEHNIFTHVSIKYEKILSIENESMKILLLHFLRLCGVHYSNISLDEKKGDLGIDKERNVFLEKNTPNGNVTYNLNKESAGIIKLLDFFVNFLVTQFDNGSILIIDEFDSNFHPSLVIKLIQLFNMPTINKNNAQLVFSSHNTNLLDPKIMRRDQFYFTEKTEEDVTRLYSLADLKGIRNDADFASQYLAGYYGAVPSLGDHEGKSVNQ